ncbi:hypothetical protein D3C80_451540 [compost metagenome]
MQARQHRQLQIDLPLFLPVEMIEHRVFKMVEDDGIELALLLLHIHAQRPVKQARRVLEAAIAKLLECPPRIDGRDGEKKIEGGDNLVDRPVGTFDRIDKGLAAKRPVTGDLQRIHAGGKGRKGLQTGIEEIGNHRLAQTGIIRTGFRLAIDRREAHADAGKIQSGILKPEDRVGFRLRPGDARRAKAHFGITDRLDEDPTRFLGFRF